ncbi:MAG: phytanoyl-CoA dioxygenase family protein, partial [Flavobacteriales bacterium]|nr:phytanoyl-CoA dioxygenase family protein [Flavobacteriales bacterium]
VTNIYFTQKNAQFRTAYYNKDTHAEKVELFEQSDTFMTDFEQFGGNIYDRPKIGKSLGLFDYHFKRLTVADLDRAYGKPVGNTRISASEKRKVPEIFQDTALQKQFDEQGFVKIPFLSEAQIKEMDVLFDKLHPELPKEGFIAGSYSSDMAYKQQVSDTIKRVFAISYERVFKNYTVFGGSYLFKMPSENSDLVLHQDWTIVDEEKYVAINCWVPLCDTNVNNGTLMVLPGAHYPNFPVHRAPTLDFFFNGNDDLVRKKLIPMNAKAGEAVILNQSLVHYSPPNLSGKIRKAITSGIKTKDAPMQFFYYDRAAKKPELDVYDMDENFLIMFDDFGKDIFLPPVNGKKVKTIAYELPQPNEQEMKKLMAKFAGEEYQEEEKEVQVAAENEQVDERSFWKTYTPSNVYREIVDRISIT